MGGIPSCRASHTLYICLLHVWGMSRPRNICIPRVYSPGRGNGLVKRTLLRRASPSDGYGLHTVIIIESMWGGQTRV